MRVLTPSLATLLVVVAAGITRPGTACADEPAEKEVFAVADGAIQLAAPKAWTKKKPSNNIVEHEFAVPKAEGDEQDGRVTVMGAQGGVDANIERWIGQFAQPDGADTKEKVKREKKSIAGQEVHLVDLSGTYKDQRGPFSGGATVQRSGYRMLGAIVVTKKLGSYFVKFYGPEKTVAANEKEFRRMIESLQVK